MKDQPDQSSLSPAAAERLARAARAAQQLSDVLWETLQEELHDHRAERASELSERLVGVSSTVALLAAARVGSSNTGSNAQDGSQAYTGAPSAGVPAASPTSAGAPVAGPTSVGPPPDAAGSSELPVERRKPPAPSRLQAPPSVAPRSTPTSVGEYKFTKLVDEQEQPLASVEPIQPEIEIRDVRREEGPSAWVTSVGRLLARHAEDGLPFAVLLVEIVDVARLERSETPHDLHDLVAQVESALGRGMRASDGLSRETLGRYWLVAPETNGTGAQMLAERLARLVRTSATHRNVPMEVAIGIAVCPDDGTEAPALAARADLGVYSARATGRSIAHTDPPAAS